MSPEDQKYINENPLTVTHVSLLADLCAKVPITHSDRTMRVFDQIMVTTGETALDPDANYWPPFNGTWAVPIGIGGVLPLHVAIDMAQVVQALSTSPLSCHFCPTGDGRFTLMRVDLFISVSIVRCCESCHKAFIAEFGDDDV